MKKLFLSLLLVFCATNMAAQAVTTQQSIFPDIQHSYLKQPMRIDVQQASKIDIGLNKDSVRLILKNPHFHEFSSSTWNYWLAVQVPNTNDYKECQLRLDFDKNQKVHQYAWSTRECDDLVNSQRTPIVVVAQPVVVPVTVQPVATAPVAELPEKIVLNSDALFAFNKSDINSILPKGKQDLTMFAQSVSRHAEHVQSLNVDAYTDRLGSSGYNQVLSQKRADTVKQFLLSNGIGLNSDKIIATGKGVSDTADCQDVHKKSALIACLAKDRKVELTVHTQ